MNKGFHEKLDLIIENQKDQNARLRKIEAWKNWMAGGMAALGVLGGPSAIYAFITASAAQKDVGEIKSMAGFGVSRSLLTHDSVQ